MLLIRLLLCLQCASTATATTSGVNGALVCANYEVGTTPSQISFQATFSVGISAIGEELAFAPYADEYTGAAVTATHAFMDASVSPTVGVTFTDVASNAVFSSIATSTDGQTLHLTLGSGTVVAGDTVYITVSSNLKAFAGPSVVSLRASSTNDAAQTITWFNILAFGTGSGLVAGDPVTYYNGKKQEFELPNDVLTPLITMPDLNVLVEPLPRQGKKEQWIGRVLVTTNDEEAAPIAEVRIKRHLAWFNRTTAHENGFETLDVTLEWFIPYPKLRVLPPHDAYFSHPTGASVLVGRVRHADKEFDMRAPRAEVVFVIGKYAKVVIFAASAHEYYGWNDYHGRKYAHLDVEIVNMREQQLFTGVLPELWGIQPLSEDVRLMMKNSTDNDDMVEEELK